MTDSHQPWWRGARGEWYVVVQVALVALLVLAPPTRPGLPLWNPALANVFFTVGIVLVLSGLGLFVAGIVTLGPSLTPLPAPRADATFVDRGPYALVRHPIYAAAVTFAYGWALVVHGWLTLLYATLMLVFVDIKARREERWLVGKFPRYREYQRRVKRLVPFVY